MKRSIVNGASRRSSPASVTPTTKPKWRESLDCWMDNVKEWFAKNWVMLVMIAVAHITFLYFFPDTWKSLAGVDVFWILQFALVLWFLLRKNKKVDFLKFAIIVLLIAGTIKRGYDWREGKIKSMRHERYASQKPSPINANSSPTAINQEGRKMVEEFYRKSKLSKEDQDRMVYISGRESRFNQFETDGKTPLRYKPKPTDPADIDKTAVGLMQIRESMWGEQAKGQKLDFVHSPEDNLKMSLYIFNKNKKSGGTGFKDWGGIPDQDEVALFLEKGIIGNNGTTQLAKRTIIAPVAPDWSEAVVGKSHWKEDACVLVKTDSGEVAESCPGKYVKINNNWAVRFQSQSRTVTNVTVD